MSQITAWADRVCFAFDVITSSAKHLPPPYPIPKPSGPALAELLRVRRLFSLNEYCHDPTSDAAKRFGQRCAGSSNRAEDLSVVTHTLLFSLDRDIARCLDAGFQHPELIHSKDFADLCPLVIPNGTVDALGTPVGLVLYAGLISSLPEEHPLREVLPLDNFYLRSGLKTITYSLFLGRPIPVMQGGASPRPFYFVADAIKLTKYYRDQQRLREQALAEEQRREEERARREFASSPVGRLRAAQAELERLRALGELPEEPAPLPPTIRGHGVGLR